MTSGTASASPIRFMMPWRGCRTSRGATIPMSPRQSDGWTSVDGTLVVDPASPVKVNYQTHNKFLAEGATQSAKGADGYYTITKLQNNTF